MTMNLAIISSTRLGLNIKCFFDGRSDMYGKTWGEQYLKIANLQPGWERTLDKNNMAWVFFGAASPLSVILLEKKEWQLVYADKVAAIFVKKIPENHFLIDRYP